ncbi:MAG: GH25 family lysozyme, partial [Saprospiraceae bacterium]
RGAYHFFLATKNGYDQAQNFIQSVKLEAGDLPPVLDIEHLYGVSADSMRARLMVWIKTVKKHYGVDPIIYTNVKFYQKHLAGFVDQYPVWVAHYLQKEKPRIERQWQFWQHSEKGKVFGIRTRVDFNVFNGTSGQFEQLLIQ